MKTILAGVCGLMLSASAGQAAIISNGSFETGSFGPEWTIVDSVGTTPPGARIVTTDGMTNSTGYGDIVPSYDGTKAAYFVSDNADQTLSQVFTLPTTGSYKLSYGLFATASGAANAGFFTLSNNLTGQSFTNSTSMTDVAVGSWTTESGTFSGVGGTSYTLTFTFLSGSQPAKDLLLDNVSINAVPLPASAPLFGAALMALGAAGFVAKRKKAAITA